MLVPSTHQAALLLLILSLVCLGSWANTFKVAKWRFELYYLDFALGALALALLAAFTFGTLGSELSFNDRIAVAGLRSQALAIASGFLFAVGNLLVVASISLAGMAVAFPLALGLAFSIAGYLGGQGAPLLFAAGVVLLLVASLVAARAALIRSRPRPGATAQASQARRSRAIKGITVGVIGGLLIGASSPLGSASFWGDLGLGAYAGMLMFCIGLAVGTGGFDLMFMNMGIEGGRVTLATYRAGTVRQHIFGLAGGALFAAGALAACLALSAPNAVVPDPSTIILFVGAAVLLNILWGVLVWKEFSNAPSAAKTATWGALLLFAAGTAAMAFRIRP